MRVFFAWFAVFVWLGVIFLFSSVPSLRSPLEPWYDFLLRKLAHMGEYALLTLLIIRALKAHALKPKKALALAILVSLVYAVSDEWHQTFVSGREGSVRDVGIDALGIISGTYPFARSKTA